MPNVDAKMLQSALKLLKQNQEKLPRIYDRVKELTREGDDRDFLLMVMEDVFLDIDSAIDILLEQNVVPAKSLFDLKMRFESEAERLYAECRKTYDPYIDGMAYAFDLARQQVEEVLGAFGLEKTG